MLNEALLEMFFFSELKSYFQKRYGAEEVRLLKPSTRREVWLGFDEGWVISDRSESELFEDLRQAIAEQEEHVEQLFVGFFLQFKVVRKRVRSSKTTPFRVTTPYFEVQISMIPSKETGLSQHETLLRVNRITNAAAAYACPLLFKSESIYQSPQLTDLMCVSLESAPDNWRLGEQHRIVMQSRTESSILWRSEPTEGEWQPFVEWVKGIEPRSASEIRGLVRSARAVVTQAVRDVEWEVDAEREVLPDSLIVVEMLRQADEGRYPRTGRQRV